MKKTLSYISAIGLMSAAWACGDTNEWTIAGKIADAT